MLGREGLMRVFRVELFTDLMIVSLGRNFLNTTTENKRLWKDLATYHPTPEQISGALRPGSLASAILPETSPSSTELYQLREAEDTYFGRLSQM